MAKCGRPPKLTEPEMNQILQEFREYIDSHDIPIVAEFAYLHRLPKEYFYDHLEFSNLLRECVTKKEANLERKGLNNEINQRITEFSLMQLGWSKQQTVDANVNLTVVDLLSALDTDSEVADK